MTDPEITAPDRRWGVWPLVRAAVSVLTVMTAAYYLLVAFDNITNPASNWAFVKGVLSGDGTPAGDGFGWRAITAPWLQVTAYVGVILAETIAGVLLAVGGVAGLRGTSRPAIWADAQRWTIVGCLVGLLVFFFGFITVGGNWFIMYLNSKWNGLDPAFQNSVMTAFTFVCVVLVLTADRLATSARTTPPPTHPVERGDQ